MTHALEIVGIKGDLPYGVSRLVEDSLKHGIMSVSKLERNWRSGQERFDQDGAGLFGAFYDDMLVGVGGTTPEKEYSEAAMRMRRLYVLSQFRRRGIARKLAGECMRHGLLACDTLTCNAEASAAAPLFWESMGFRSVDLPNITHVYDDRAK